MTDRYAVIGHPIAHSRSPAIHAQFARQTGEDIHYDRLLAPLDGFEATVREFFRSGGRGLNVTLPFKEQACALAERRSSRVQLAGAANTLSVEDGVVAADNTDGIGLVRDLTGRHRLVLTGAPVVILGAGGAASGVVLPLLEAGASRVLIVNRTAARALALAARFADPRVRGGGFEALDADSAAGAVLVNATSAGLSDQGLPIPDSVYPAARFAYDMVYAAAPTAFLRQAAAAGCAGVADGLGMLVEQAAESFRIWRGVLPETEPVYRQLRDALGSA
jgi:shikimate dehydrogenase